RAAPQAPAQHGRLPGGDALEGRAPLVAPTPLQRAPGSRDGVGDRRCLRRVGGRGQGARPARATGYQPAPDAACLRGDRAPDDQVRDSDPAPGGALEPRMRRALALAAAAVVAAGAISGCGERKERLGPSKTQQLQLLLDFFPNADHAGIYAAQAKGRFRQVGLDVKIRAPSDPAAPIRQVAAGRADIAISYEPEVLRARDHGLKVVAVGALVQR